MNLTSLLLAALSLMSLTEVASATGGFDVEARRVDVISVVHTVTQMDSEKDARQGKRVDVIENIQSSGPAYSYARPVNH